MVPKTDINKPIQRQTIDPKLLASYRQPIEQALSVYKKNVQAFLAAAQIKDPSRVYVKIDENTKVPLNQFAPQAVKKHDSNLLLQASVAFQKAARDTNINELHQKVFLNDRKKIADQNAETAAIEIALSQPEAMTTNENKAIFAGTITQPQPIQVGGQVANIEQSSSSMTTEEDTKFNVYSNKAYSIMLSGIKGSKDYFEV